MSGKTPGIKMLVVLVGVCLISAAVLGYVHITTYDRIEMNRMKRIKDAVYQVLPGVTEYEQVNEKPVIYKGYKDETVIGYAVLAEGMGFQGNIVLMVGIDKEIKNIKGTVVLESVETPGLGDRIKEDSFLDQFDNTAVSENMKVSAITGATISSVAVEKIANKSVKDVKRIH
ncbi:FMN-binding protein [Elusimicrobiota bacterium]